MQWLTGTLKVQEWCSSGKWKKEKRTIFLFQNFCFHASKMLHQYIISISMFPLTFFPFLQLAWLQLQWILLGKTKTLPPNLSERRQTLFYQSCKVNFRRRCKQGGWTSVSLCTDQMEWEGTWDIHTDSAAGSNQKSVNLVSFLWSVPLQKFRFSRVIPALF